MLLQREREGHRPGWMQAEEKRFRGMTREEEEARRRDVWKRVQMLEAENREVKRQNEEALKANEELEKSKPTNSRREQGNERQDREFLVDL